MSAQTKKKATKPKNGPVRSAPSTKSTNKRVAKSKEKKEENTKRKNTTKTKRKPSPKCGKCRRVKKNCKCGRPTKLEYEVVKKLKDIFRIDGTIAEACAYARISKQTYHDWINKGVKFLDQKGRKCCFVEAMEEAKTFAILAAKKTLVNAAANGDTKAAIEFLKRRHKDYKDKQSIDHKINDYTIDDDQQEQIDLLISSN